MNFIISIGFNDKNFLYVSDETSPVSAVRQAVCTLAEKVVPDKVSVDFLVGLKAGMRALSPWEFLVEGDWGEADIAHFLVCSYTDEIDSMLDLSLVSNNLVGFVPEDHLNFEAVLELIDNFEPREY